jgi:hypothetical protein
MARPGYGFRRLALVAGVASALLTAGCASSDLSANAKVGNEVAEALPTGTPAPDLVARAIWYPKAEGPGAADSTPIGHAVGVLALAGDHLWFLVWNDALGGYDTIQSLPVLTARRISFARFGSEVMLVVESRNLSFDSFELMKGGQFVSDPETTRELYERLAGLRARNPQPDP